VPWSWTRNSRDSSLCFSPDGRTLASAGADHTVKLWYVRSGQEWAGLKGHTDGVTSLCFSPDGKPRRIQATAGARSGPLRRDICGAVGGVCVASRDDHRRRGANQGDRCREQEGPETCIRRVHRRIWHLARALRSSATPASVTRVRNRLSETSFFRPANSLSPASVT
jgi:hypothetical protein